MKNDTKKNTKKYMTWVDIFIMLGLIVCFSIAVPFLMNVFYGRGCPLIDAWDKSDLMGYYGSIMTAVAAIAGVYFTLDYSKFKQIEYEKLRVKPYIYNDAAIHVPINDDFISTCKADQIYIYKSLHSGLTEKSEGELPPRIKLINQKDSGFDKKYFINNSVILDMTLKNLGAESAVKIKFYMNNEISSNTFSLATVYKGNIIKNLIMDCQSYTKYRPNETTGGIFVSWRRKEELPTGLD